MLANVAFWVVQVLLAAALALIPAVAVGLFAARLSRRNNPQDAMGPALAFILTAIPTGSAALVALLWWGL